MVTDFDLFGLQQGSNLDELAHLRKRDLRNLLTSYADEADVFAEIIQNAFDAVRLASDQGLYTGGEKPRIDVVIGRRSGGDPHYLLVCDNGIGMSPAVAAKFTMPGFSHGKRLGSTVGYKGVGASFFFAAANKISFLSIDREGHRSQATVTGAFSWIMSNHEPQPTISDQATFPQAVMELLAGKRGTALYYEFHAGLKPKSLSHLVQLDNQNATRELKNWAFFLCAKTALGQVTLPIPVQAEVNLHLDSGQGLHSTKWSIGEYDVESFKLGYPYPWRVFKVHKDITDIEATPVAQQHVLHSGKHQALRLRWSKAHVDALTPAIDFTVEERDLVETHFDFMDIFFAYSTEVLQEVQKRGGTVARLVRYGVRLACDGIPQGRMLEFDLTSNQGLSRQAHALVAFKNLELDTGRKVPANENVSEVIRKLTVRGLSLLTDYRWAMKRKARPEPSVDLDRWRNDTKERIASSIVRPLFEKIGPPAPLRVDPDMENDVIALFSALLARRILKGYELLALSGFNRYDGLINIQTDTAELKDPDDPLAIRDTEKNRAGQFKVLEFKYQFEDLLTDFDAGNKRPQDIDLFVCWTLPDINVRRGRIQYTYGDRNDFRQLYGMTHLWSDENNTSQIPIISMKHFVAEKLASLEGDNPAIGRARFEELLNLERTQSV